MNDLQSTFGNIDIYLFDQLLKGRFDGCSKIIDIGCGGGRNIVYFLRNGYQVFGIDRDEQAIAGVRSLSQELAPGNPVTNFVVSKVEENPFEHNFFDVAICSAVLHFAADPTHFDKMLRATWNVIKPGGYLFARLASDIGMENVVVSKGNGRYLLPDGTTRFLVNEQTLLRYTAELGGELFEPIKTTNVSNLRCMTTWCVQKQ
jgi:tellurite methyltransferase